MDDLGPKLRQARQEKGWTLGALSDRCGLSTSFLSQVERGLTTLSIVSLSSICRALDRPMETLFSSSGPLAERAHTVTKADRQLHIRIGGSPISYRYLTGQLPSAAIEELLIAEFPASFRQPCSVHQGEEFGYVLDGALVLTIGGREFGLIAGDSYRIGAAESHEYATSSEGGAKILMAVTERFINVPPEAGATGPETVREPPSTNGQATTALRSVRKER